MKFFRLDAACMVEAESFAEAANQLAEHIHWIGSQFADDDIEDDADVIDHESPIMRGNLTIGPCDEKGTPIKDEA